MLLEAFKPIVDLIFNNWSALQLAVEHGMGTPGGKQTAQMMSDYVANYCIEKSVDVDTLTDILEDLMDEEFETACQDGSPKEVATVLIHFLSLLKDGRHDQLRAEIDAMPKCQIWLSQPIAKPNVENGDDESSSDDEPGLPNPCSNGVQIENNDQMDTDEPMDEDPDPGWTVVRTRRKK